MLPFLIAINISKNCSSLCNYCYTSLNAKTTSCSDQHV